MREIFSEEECRIIDNDSGLHFIMEMKTTISDQMLNSLLRINNMDVYVTGSNSKFLSSDIVTEFRGRGDEIRIELNRCAMACQGCGAAFL